MDFAYPAAGLVCVGLLAVLALLLSVTNHLDENVAAVPLLWVLPLAVYLLTFIIAFNRPVGRTPRFTDRICSICTRNSWIRDL